ncbi:hypothetical protein ABEB36_003212 [Hypothenemus hampei]|uniref:Ribosomal protein S10 n=1 Tax=Hypothenemus hampei TaxID=57062 RepID=A0ABD1F950_HYPHA
MRFYKTTYFRKADPETVKVVKCQMRRAHQRITTFRSFLFHSQAELPVLVNVFDRGPLPKAFSSSFFSTQFEANVAQFRKSIFRSFWRQYTRRLDHLKFGLNVSERDKLEFLT